jgi:hypothetical protein
MLFMTSAESSVVGNQRGSTRALYAAMAGLEEASARFFPYHPDAYSKVTPALTLPSAVGQVIYIINPSGGETINPMNLSAANPYADVEFQDEFGVPVTSGSVTVRTIPSSSLGTTPLPYKWVRITVKTEQAARQDINGDGVLDNTIPVFYKSGRQNLTGTGERVYRLTSLAVLADGTRQLAQADVVAVRGGGFKYAIASGHAITGIPAGTLNGNVFSNTEIVLRGPVTVVDGNVESATEISGGSLTLNGSHQARANSGVSTTVSGGGSPNAVSGPGTVTPKSTPSTPTPSPLPPDTMPNPAWTDIQPLITQTVTGSGCTFPGSPNALGGCDWNLGNGSVVNFTTKQSFGPNDRFLGTGTIVFSGGQSVDFSNPIGTAAAPAQINIIARPSNNNAVGFDTFSFFQDVYINGLIYSHGEVYHKSCNTPGNHAFVVKGSVIAYASGGGGIPNGDFEAATCSFPFDVRYDPSQFAANPPPGFGGLLLGLPGSGGVPLLNWRER